MCFRVKTTSCTTFSEPQSSCTDPSMLSLPPFQIPTHPPGLFFFLCSFEFAPFFILLTYTAGNTRGTVKDCSLKEEHTTPHACENCNLGSPNKACAGDGGRRRANTGIKFHTSCEGGRGEKDSLPLQEESFLLLHSKTVSFPLPSSVPDLPPQSLPTLWHLQRSPLLSSRGNVEASPSC